MHLTGLRIQGLVSRRVSPRVHRNGTIALLPWLALGPLLRLHGSIIINVLQKEGT